MKKYFFLLSCIFLVSCSTSASVSENLPSQNIKATCDALEKNMNFSEFAEKYGMPKLVSESFEMKSYQYAKDAEYCTFFVENGVITEKTYTNIS